jgi:hypothetical protein
MTSHVSAPVRKETPHETEPTKIRTGGSQTLETSEDVSDREKIEALADIICGAGDQAAGALFVLMGALQNSTEPEALAHTVKHFAFTRCGELNLYGMVDAHIAVVEGELLANTAPVS